MEQFRYNNITFNYHKDWVCDFLGICDRKDGIGFTMLDIPSEHIIGMKRNGYRKEIEHNGRTLLIPPHTFKEDYRDGYHKSTNDELIDSYNTDLHIVYIKWMLEHPRKQFEIDITCENPYWIFHDIAHSEDVQGNEVCCLSESLESYRLQQGLEIMVEADYLPEFDEKYYDMIKQSHYNRWKKKLDNDIFSKYVKEFEYENEY